MAAFDPISRSTRLVLFLLLIATLFQAGGILLQALTETDPFTVNLFHISTTTMLSCITGMILLLTVYNSICTEVLGVHGVGVSFNLRAT